MAENPTYGTGNQGAQISCWFMHWHCLPEKDVDGRFGGKKCVTDVLYLAYLHPSRSPSGFSGNLQVKLVKASSFLFELG
jgi:hypothetical protein